MMLFKNHPPELKRLFLVEMWERFSYFGLAPLITLFMTSDIASGGLAKSPEYASIVYTTYATMIYLLGVPISLWADNLIGAANSVFIGGCCILLGHITLALPFSNTFLIGLAFVAIGTGFLKPSISSLVAELYGVGNSTRKSKGMALFYMGISLGGFFGPIVLGYARHMGIFEVSLSWHFAFSLAAIGMFVALMLFLKTWKTNKNIKPIQKISTYKLTAVSAAFFSLFILLLYGVIYCPLVVCFFYLLIPIIVAWLWFTPGRERVALLGLMFLVSITISAIVAQMSSQMPLATKNYVDHSLFGMNFYDEYFMGCFSGFIILLAVLKNIISDERSGIFSYRHAFYAGLLCFALALIIIGSAFLFLSGQKISPWIILVAYFFKALAEILIVPSALALMSDISKPENRTFTMSVWFVGAGMGATLSGLISKISNLSEYVTKDIGQASHIILQQSLIVSIFVVIMFFVSNQIAKRVCLIKESN